VTETVRAFQKDHPAPLDGGLNLHQDVDEMIAACTRP
jgi:hypothetical protein